MCTGIHVHRQTHISDQSMRINASLNKAQLHISQRILKITQRHYKIISIAQIPQLARHKSPCINYCYQIGVDNDDRITTRAKYNGVRGCVSEWEGEDLGRRWRWHPPEAPRPGTCTPPASPRRRRGAARPRRTPARPPPPPRGGPSLRPATSPPLQERANHQARSAGRTTSKPKSGGCRARKHEEAEVAFGYRHAEHIMPRGEGDGAGRGRPAAASAGGRRHARERRHCKVAAAGWSLGLTRWPVGRRMEGIDWGVGTWIWMCDTATACLPNYSSRNTPLCYGVFD